MSVATTFKRIQDLENIPFQSESTLVRTVRIEGEVDWRDHSSIYTKYLPDDVVKSWAELTTETKTRSATPQKANLMYYSR